MAQLQGRAEAVRAFNRFYTGRIGVLEERHLGSRFSLTEVRVLYELAHRQGATAAEIGSELGLDPGYLSRILRSFRRKRLVTARRSSADRRRAPLELTEAGRKAFAPLDARARDRIADLLRPLPELEQRRLLDAMQLIRRSMGGGSETPESAAPVTLRPHRPGDMGWVVHRHGALYAQEYGWDERFEALVARVVADFIEHLDPARERCWIAERDGAIVGSIFVVAKSKTVAKLRLLLVEPSARGLGIGGRLVDEVIAFARQAGYRKIMLWTQSNLTAARRIYEAKGFRLVAEEGHEMFGEGLVSETWELALHARP